jgi:glycosyl transferase family 25
MFEFVEKVVYINLEHRSDRKEQIETELSKYFQSEKIQRFNAITHKHGGVGCSASHIAVLEMAIAEGWNNCLIVEDDAAWKNFEKGYPIFEKLVQSPFDVIMLGAAHADMSVNFRIMRGKTTTAYLVNKDYYNTLLETFQASFNIFKNIENITSADYGTYAIDVSWFPLQRKDKWYCIFPSLMVQRSSYSDIEKRFVDYSSYFG